MLRQKIIKGRVFGLFLLYYIDGYLLNYLSLASLDKDTYMKKIAVVVQRYGFEINGGAEVHARILAERLNVEYRIEVLTTTRKEYIEGASEHYDEGEEDINGIKVRRFKVCKGGNGKSSGNYLRRNFRYSNRKVTVTNFFYLPLVKIFYRKSVDHDLLFEQWMRSGNFHSEELINFIRHNQDLYTAFIFFTYLYHPAYAGLQVVGHKSIFIPTAHDEYPFYYSGMNKLFSQPKFIMYNTISEKELVERNYPQTKIIKSDIAGIGFDKPQFELQSVKVDCQYFVYIGRIDKGKGCKELIDYFLKFRESYNGELKLVMIGNNYMKKVEVTDDIIFTGFIGEEEKLSYLRGSEALIISSPNESLSMVTLEAMIMGKPVLVTSKSEVLKSHIEVSKAGFIYYNQNEFNRQLTHMLNLSEEGKNDIAEKGISYVENNYSWANIMNKFDQAISYVESNK